MNLEQVLQHGINCVANLMFAMSKYQARHPSSQFYCNAKSEVYKRYISWTKPLLMTFATFISSIRRQSLRNVRIRTWYAKRSNTNTSSRAGQRQICIEQRKGKLSYFDKSVANCTTLRDTISLSALRLFFTFTIKRNRNRPIQCEAIHLINDTFLPLMYLNYRPMNKLRHREKFGNVSEPISTNN